MDPGCDGDGGDTSHFPDSANFSGAEGQARPVCWVFVTNNADTGDSQRALFTEIQNDCDVDQDKKFSGGKEKL